MKCNNGKTRITVIKLGARADRKPRLPEFRIKRTTRCSLIYKKFDTTTLLYYENTTDPRQTKPRLRYVSYRTKVLKK